MYGTYSMGGKGDEGRWREVEDEGRMGGGREEVRGGKSERRNVEEDIRQVKVGGGRWDERSMSMLHAHVAQSKDKCYLCYQG